MAPPPDRLARLPARRLGGGLTVHEARGLRARLLGLAMTAGLAPGRALLIERCRSVHTFGMRYPLDLLFLGPRGVPVRLALGVPPGRVVSCAAARAVLEAPAGEGELFASALGGG